MRVPVEKILGGFVCAYLVREGDAAVIVDSGLPGAEKRIIHALDKRQVKPNMVKAILLTHGHIDHIGGAQRLRNWCGAPIAVHQLDAILAQSGGNGSLQPTGPVGTLLARASAASIAPHIPGFMPDILLQGSDDLSHLGIRIRVLHAPGHTPGSAVYLLPGRQALIGDLALVQPIKQYAGMPFLIDDADIWRASVQMVNEYRLETLYASHWGAISGKSFSEWVHHGMHAFAYHH